MTTVRETWTDERLDDLSRRVEGGFRETREEMRAGFEQVDTRFGRVEGGLERVNDRIDSLQRTMAHGVIALTAAILTGFSGIVVLIATQL